VNDFIQRRHFRRFPSFEKLINTLFSFLFSKGFYMFQSNHFIFRRVFGMFLLAALGACGESNTNQNPVSTESLYAAPPALTSTSAIFNGLRSNYSITAMPTGNLVVDKVGSDGSLLVDSKIQLLVFKDISINLAVPKLSLEIPNKDLVSITELYIAYFSRVPDANGLSYWINEFKNGMTLDQIGESFYSAGLQYSAQTGYTPTMSNADFVTVIYKNVLGRPTPDKEGLAYWSNALSSGSETRGTLVRTILNSAHTFKGDATYGWVAQLLDNKYDVAKDFSVNQGISYVSDVDSISKGIAIAATVTPTDTSVAKGLIEALVGVKATTTDIPTQAQAARFLSQATFGPNASSIDAVMSTGLSSWMETQFNAPPTSHRLYMDKAAAGLSNGLSGLSQNNFYESFWQQAVNGNDQLRQRIAFSLSQILVISFQDSGVNNYPRGVASYYDVLENQAFGNFRDLLENVSLHPMMGLYLTSLKNQKEAGTRVPDENYAREVMQLFTIGLYKLNLDGSYQLTDGKPIETYTNADITGLAKVFTGWSWFGPDKTNSRFFGGSADPNRDWQAMQSYPAYHSTSQKTFLGVTIPAQGTSNPEASLKIALDTLFNHQNVGPFIGKQLIQRLVTSNPSPQYVARVATAFNNNGQGVRGDMKSVIKAVLLDSEARNEPNLNNAGIGKLREPALRIANWMRAFNAKSTSTLFRITNLDDPLSGLAQTPMRSPTVFNFYRPGYVPPNSGIANAALVSPEMQITAETSVVGYLNYMRDAISNGVGTSRDVKADYSTLTPLANDANALINQVNLLLMSNQMSSTLRSQIVAAVNSIAIPTSSASSADAAKLNRVYLSIYLTMAAPEYLTQK
jgi:uncharacterized protein (DUF1800 family)